MALSNVHSYICVICIKKNTNFAPVKRHMANPDNQDIEALLIRRLKNGDVFCISI